MAILVLSSSGTSERSLQSVSILDITPEHHHSGSRFLSLLKVESTIFIVEVVLPLPKHEGEDPLLQFVRSGMCMTSIHEQVLIPRMTMDISEEVNWSALQSLLDHCHTSVNFRMQLRVWSSPLSVKVNPSQGATVISYNYTIWVEHGDNFEYEQITQLSSRGCIRHKIVNNAFHDERSITFSRMDPCA